MLESSAKVTMAAKMPLQDLGMHKHCMVAGLHLHSASAWTSIPGASYVADQRTGYGTHVAAVPALASLRLQ